MKDIVVPSAPNGAGTPDVGAIADKIGAGLGKAFEVMEVIKYVGIALVVLLVAFFVYKMVTKKK